MTETGGEPRKASEERGAAAKAATGLSAFITRILEQLSLSAWLPAAMLVGSLTVLVQLHTQDNRSLVQAVKNLRDKPVGVLVLLVFTLILTTMVTQAFEFEVIRVLEGYWGTSWLAKPLASMCVARQRRRLVRIQRRFEAVQLKAYRCADIPGLLPGRKQYVAVIIEADLKGRKPLVAQGWLGWRKRREARRYRWEPHAPAELMRRRDVFVEELAEYPEEGHRLLPTKLGNLLRAVEDELPLGPGEGVEEYVLRRWDFMSEALRHDHDQYRTRLDMYCTLVFVFALLAAVAPALLTRGRDYLLPTALITLGYAFLTVVSSGAALATARGYVTVLATIPPGKRASARGGGRRRS